jgi:O-antigen/teichoic acid export membrane protein
MGLAKRSINSATWNTISNLIGLPVGLAQSIILARLLPIEYFGIYAGVFALIVLVNHVFEFGVGTAYLHRSAETEDEIHSINVLFSLRLILYTARMGVYLVLAFFVFSELRQLVLIVLAVMGWLTGLAQTPSLILVRRVEHRRLAFLRLTNSLIVATFSIMIAITTGSIWALLISSVVTFIWTLFMLHVWRPIWRPRLVWDVEVMKYYLSFGGRVQISNILNNALNTIDDLWTNIFLGDVPLGYYSRAYKFATYPRLVLAAPLERVAVGTYAELKTDRERLSKAFFRVNALLVRSAFLLGGWLFLIAPEFILIFLGERWMPMLTAFQLMLIYTLLDPLKGTIANAIIALGMPEKVVKARAVQLLLLVVGLFVLGGLYNIEGVAIAVNIMLIAGIILLLRVVRAYVDVSYWKLFLAPSLAIAAGLLVTFGILSIWELDNSMWIAALVKSFSFSIVYILVLWGIEGKDLIKSLREIYNQLGINQ